ncbi:MAG: hypothetical protein IJY61_08280 [Candidatus Gastranaerophilales bacterium]|nr:hypothetical protein [Candidatus Gastranaerophilales bacterium]
MKRFTKKELLAIEENLCMVGIELSKITSLVKFLDLAINNETSISGMDIANLTSLLKQRIFEINVKYEKIETLLEV